MMIHCGMPMKRMGMIGVHVDEGTDCEDGESDND